MKIASVTFFPYKENVSGAHVSAIAFQAWCEILGIECDVIGIREELIGRIGKHLDENIDMILSSNGIELLNEYDAIFFSSYPMLCKIDIDKIKKPFIIMEHSDQEAESFGNKTISEFLEHPMSIYANNVDDWFPCCMPEFLWKGEIKPKKDFGLLYAARIFEMKNPILFMKMANESLHLTQKAKMTGVCHSKHLGYSLRDISGGVKFKPERFNKEIFTSKQYGLYWEVFGSLRKPVIKHRINLSAIEAISNGMMPIVNPASIPINFSLLFIELYPFWYDEKGFCRLIVNYAQDKERKWNRINETFSTSNYSYIEVEKQFIKLIEKLENKNVR